MIHPIVIALTTLLTACGGGGSSSPSKDDPPLNLPDSRTFPGASWQTHAAADLGIAESGITAALDYAFAEGRNTQGVVIVKNGVIVGERYAQGASQDTMATSWSTGKSVASTLIGIAVDAGDIASIDDPAEAYLPTWVGTDRDAVTVRAILEMRSGLGLASDDPTDFAIYVNGGDQLAYALDRVPATTPRTDNWVYQNTDSMLLGGIIENATGQNVLDYADGKLFSKIGMTATWWTDVAGHALTYCCIDATTRDFARFGLLIARGGKWGSAQVVSSAWVDEATMAVVPVEVDESYGLQWWVNPELDYFYSAGMDQNDIYIFPQHDLLIVRNSLYTRTGDSTIRTASNWIRTVGPILWSDADFVNYVTDAIN
tara:strand:- start:7222 stop:8334 length:1113 start_codon:yes stop_codon:yes gene_type:complete